MRLDISVDPEVIFFISPKVVREGEEVEELCSFLSFTHVRVQHLDRKLDFRVTAAAQSRRIELQKSKKSDNCTRQPRSASSQAHSNDYFF